MTVDTDNFYEADARLRKESEVSSYTKPVYDGDTFKVVVRPWIGDRTYETIRVYGVDTDELYGVDHDRAVGQRQFTENWLHKQHESSNEFPLRLRAYGEDSFGRILAHVYDENESECLNDKLLSEYTGIKYKE